MDQLGHQISVLWSQLLDLLSKLVIPDWGSLVGLLPVLLLGPIALFLLVMAGAWTRAALLRKRPRSELLDGPRRAEIGEAGSPVFPPGEPFCVRDSLVYSPGTTRCDECRNPLAVRCPMCGIERAAEIVTCGNCGLVLRVERRARVVRPAGPPPGGAAIA